MNHERCRFYWLLHANAFNVSRSELLFLKELVDSMQKNYEKPSFIVTSQEELEQKLEESVPVNKSGQKKCFFLIFFFKSGQFLSYFFGFIFRSGPFLLYEFRCFR